MTQPSFYHSRYSFSVVLRKIYVNLIQKWQKKRIQTKQTKKKKTLPKKVFTINKHSEMPCIITGINFMGLEHSMTGSYKEDWSVKVAGKQKTHCGSGEKHIGSWFWIFSGSVSRSYERFLQKRVFLEQLSHKWRGLMVWGFNTARISSLFLLPLMDMKM